MNKYPFFSGVLTLISSANYDKATVKPTCPENGRIRIIYANFGRTVQDHLLCPYGRRHGNVVDCEAHREIYTSTARELCDGKNSCTVTNIEELGDPCRGTYKYLEVRFTCTSKSFPYLKWYSVLKNSFEIDNYNASLRWYTCTYTVYILFNDIYNSKCALAAVLLPFQLPPQLPEDMALFISAYAEINWATGRWQLWPKTITGSSNIKMVNWMVSNLYIFIFDLV